MDKDFEVKYILKLNNMKYIVTFGDIPYLSFEDIKFLCLIFCLTMDKIYLLWHSLMIFTILYVQIFHPR